MNWKRIKVGEKEEWIVEKEKIVSLLTPLSSADFSFSNNKRIKEKEGIIIHNGQDCCETCFINKELNIVYFINFLIYYYMFL